MRVLLSSCKLLLVKPNIQPEEQTQQAQDRNWQNTLKGCVLWAFLKMYDDNQTNYLF